MVGRCASLQAATLTVTWLFRSAVNAERTYTTLDVAEPFPAGCTSCGNDPQSRQLLLHGRYRARGARTLCSGCEIIAHNAIVELDAATIKGDGWLYLEGNLTLTALSPTEGPCMFVDGSLDLREGSSLTILNCRNKYDEEVGREGGALWTKGRTELYRSQLVIRNASTGRKLAKKRRLEALYARDTFLPKARQIKPKLTQGGCAFLQNGLYMREASASFEQCRADVGGCVASHGNFFLNQSELNFKSCNGAYGGGLYLGHKKPDWREDIKPHALLQMGPRSGKGKKAANPQGGTSGPGRGPTEQTSLTSAGGRVSFRSCSAALHGAGLHILLGNFSSNATEMVFENCSSGGKGGGIFAERSILRQRGGVMSFRSMKAVHGGSIYVKQLVQEEATMNFVGSYSRKNGGAVSTATGVDQEGGLLSFEACESGKLGGAIMVSPQGYLSSIRSSGVIRCSDTYALMGGCLGTIGRGAVRLNHFELHHSASQVLGNLAYVRGPFSAENVSIADESIRIDAAIVGLNTSNVSFLDCSETPSCHLRAVNLTLGPAVCSPGSGIGTKIAGGEEFRGCFRCEDGKAQLRRAMDPHCQTCPYEAEVCMPNFTQLESGVMANPENFSRVLHCPNARACPGGALPKSPAQPMCAEGYDGDGCANCSEAFGRSDSSVLVCVKCASGWQAEGLQLAYFVLSDAVLLAVATSSVLGASATSQDSSVLLNQLMSFATVAQTVLSAISQTAAYKKLSNRLKIFLEVSGVLSAVAQGESSWSMSRECLLASLGLPKTIWHVHLISAILQGLLLMLLVFLQGFWFAFVVWTNCFAPSISASFGRYLVGYRLEPERVGGKMHFPFLPPVAMANEFVLGMLALCFVATTGGWWMAANSKRLPDPDYVVFLVRNYKPAYRNWETERLLRKMLLRLVASALPIAYSPALQMWCVCLILSASLLSYSIQRPYRLEAWNQVETLLLCVALVLAFSASAVLANEKHWGSSRDTQVLVLLSMALLATATTLTLSAFVARRLYKERIQKFFTDADEA